MRTRTTIQTRFTVGKEKFEVRETSAPFCTGIIDPDWPYTIAPGVENRSEKQGKGVLSGFTRNRDESLNKYAARHPLSIKDLATLPIGDLVGGYLLMWTVAPFLIGGMKNGQSSYSAALYLMEQWGFEACSMLTWGKYNLNRIRRGESSGGYGGIGYWFLGNSEYVVVGKKKGLPSIRTGYSSLFLEPKKGHSEKPENIHRLAEARFPGPYVEIFGRRPYPGWTVLGNEAPGDGKDIRETIQKKLSAHSQSASDIETVAPVGDKLISANRLNREHFRDAVVGELLI